MKSPIKLLVVDDDENFRNSLSIALRKQNFIVSESPGVGDALSKLRGDYFDWVITDYKMSEEGGLDLIRCIKKDFPKTKIILVTAYASEELEKKCSELKIDGYFAKPFSMSLLIETLNKSL